MATFGYANKPYLPAALQQQMLLDPRYQMASQLAKPDTSPVASPLAGIARMLSGALGGYQLGKVQQEYQKQGEGYNQALAQALRAGQQGVKGWVDPDTGQQAIPDVAPGKDAMMTAISMSGNPMLQEEASRAQMASMLKGGDSEFERVLSSTALSPEQKEELKLQYLQTKATAISPYQMFNLQEKIQNRQDKQDAEEKKQQERLDANLNAGAEKYSKSVTDSGIADIINSIEQFNNSTRGVEDLPGFGAGYSLPDLLVGEGGRDLRQTVSTIRNNILKARSGGAVTPQEAERFLQELGEGYTKNDKQLLTGVANLEQAVREKLNNIASGYDPRSIEIYKKRGGKVTPNRLNGDDPQNLNAGGEATGGGPAVVAPANANPSAPEPEITAVNPQTGQRIKFVNGQWVESQ